MTKEQEYLNNLLDDLHKAMEWLDWSYRECKKIGIKNKYTNEEFVCFEALTGRFARVVDMLIQKVYRTIEILELEEPGTIIDTMNKAEKKELIDSAKYLREIKEFRNKISHDYINKDIIEAYKKSFEYTPKVLDYVYNVFEYCKRFKG